MKGKVKGLLRNKWIEYTSFISKKLEEQKFFTHSKCGVKCRKNELR